LFYVWHGASLMEKAMESDGDSLQAQRLVEQFQRLIQSIEAGGRVILPRTNHDLLQSVVEAAARIFGAAAAAIALITEDGRELEFKVAYNQ
jgi:uncharacterized protein YigA (DUF484 family)